MKIWWQPGLPPELQAIALPLIEKHIHFLPTWIHELCVKYDPENINSATVQTEQQYRRAHLTLTGHFIKADFEEREEVIRHEFLHTPLHPLTNWTKDLIERLADDDTRLKEWLFSEWEERLEGAVCDLEKIKWTES